MKTHKETYPEQYTHPLCGALVTMEDGREFKVGRVVDSRFGKLFIPEGSDGTMAYGVSNIIEVNGRIIR